MSFFLSQLIVVGIKLQNLNVSFVRVQKYIEQITSKTKPAKILVCMIYYLDENKTESWAGTLLEAMGYDSDPSKLQMFIRR